MSITDELRHYISGPAKSGISHICEKAIANIVDRIDAEHESACGEAYGNGVESVALPDLTAYVKLPLDADGVPIRLGDVMENVVHPPTHREVTGVGVECFYAWEDGCGRYSQFGANCYRHYHAPTVEDLLREFTCVLIGKREFDGDVAEAISEYADKLRLRGDAE